jgi:hypothetical protein
LNGEDGWQLVRVQVKSRQTHYQNLRGLGPHFLLALLLLLLFLLFFFSRLYPLFFNNYIMTTNEPIMRSLSPIDETKRLEFESGDESESGSSVVAQSYALSSASHIVDGFTTSSPPLMGEFDLAAATTTNHEPNSSCHPPSATPEAQGEHDIDAKNYIHDHKITSGSTGDTHFHPHPTESRSSSTSSAVKDELWALHADELVSLAQRQGPVVKPSDSYSVLAWKIIKQYIHYLVGTWSRCLWSLLVLPSSK